MDTHLIWSYGLYGLNQFVGNSVSSDMWSADIRTDCTHGKSVRARLGRLSKSGSSESCLAELHMLWPDRECAQCGLRMCTAQTPKDIIFGMTQFICEQRNTRTAHDEIPSIDYRNNFAYEDTLTPYLILKFEHGHFTTCLSV